MLGHIRVDAYSNLKVGKHLRLAINSSFIILFLARLFLESSRLLVDGESTNGSREI